MFGVESGLCTVHIPLGRWTVDLPCKAFFSFSFYLVKTLEFNYGSSISRFPDKGAESAAVFVLFGLGSRNLESRR